MSQPSTVTPENPFEQLKAYVLELEAKLAVLNDTNASAQEIAKLTSRIAEVEALKAEAERAAIERTRNEDREELEKVKAQDQKEIEALRAKLAELAAPKLPAEAPEELAQLRAEIEKLNGEIEELRKKQPQPQDDAETASQLSADPEELNLAQLKAEIKRLEALKAAEEEKVPVTVRSIAGEVANMVLSIPAELAKGLVYVVNPNNAGRIYSGWAGKFGVLALFSAFVSNVLPRIVNATVIGTGLSFLARAAFPQLSIAADLLQFMATSEFMFASVITASELFDKGFNGENGKVLGKDLAKDFVKKLLPHSKEPATGYALKDWRQWLFSKITDFAGVIGGSLGTAYGIGLAVTGARFGTAFFTTLPVAGPIAAIGAGVFAVVSNLAMIALGSTVGGFMLFGSKEIYDFVGGLGSTFGQQQWANVTGAAYTVGARAANVTGVDVRYEGAKQYASASATSAYNYVSGSAASVRDGASARLASTKAMVFGNRSTSAPEAPAAGNETQNVASVAADQVDTGLDTSARNDESCIRSTMRTICRI